MTLALNMNESAPFFHVKCESRRFWKEEKKVSLFALLCSPYSLPFFSMHINCTILRVCLQLPLANIHVAIMKLNIRLYYQGSTTSRARTLCSSLCFHFISTGCFGSFEEAQNPEKLSNFCFFFPSKTGLNSSENFQKRGHKVWRNFRKKGTSGFK